MSSSAKVALDKKKKKKTLCLKERNSQKRNTQNLNFKEENCSRFYSCGLERTVVKKMFVQLRSSSPSLLFCRYETSPFPPRTSASVRRKGSPSSSWRWRRRCYRWSVDTYHISSLAMTGWGMGRGVVHLCWTCLETCLELLKSRYLVSLYSDLMDYFEGSMITSENSSTTRESARVIILK